jgi:glycosyltransferase involved in cell wall biosynthesis
MDQEKYCPIVLVHALGPLTDELEKNEVQVYCRPFAWWVFMKEKHGALKRLKKNVRVCQAILREGWIRNVDLIYTNTAVVPLGGMLSWYCKIPHLWHIREFVEEASGFQFDYPRKLSGFLVGRWSKSVVFNSLAVKNKFSKYLKPGQGTVVYNGVVDGDEQPGRFSEEKNIQQGTIRICIVGAISEAKGLDVAIAALKLLSEKVKQNVSLHVFGDGLPAEIEKMKSLADRLQISENVIWEGYCSDVTNIFAQSDICWVSSRSEAFGRVVVEAMAHGVPVVAGNTGGIPEIVSDGETGCLFPVGDQGRLAQITCDLINDTEKYCAIRRQGYHAAFERFGRGRYISELSQVIDSIVE